MTAAVNQKPIPDPTPLVLPDEEISIEKRLIRLFAFVNESVEDAVNEKQQLSSKLSEIEQHGALLKKEIDLLQRDLAVLKTCNTDQAESIASLKKTIADRELVILQLNSEFQLMQSELQEIKDSEARHKKTIADLKDQVRVLNANIEEKTNEIKMLSAQILKLMESEQAKLATLAKYEADIQQFKHDRGNFITHISTQNIAIAELKKASALHAQTIAYQSGQIDKLKVDLSEKHKTLLEVCIAAGDLEDRIYELTRPGAVGKFINRIFKRSEFQMSRIPVPPNPTPI